MSEAHEQKAGGLQWARENLNKPATFELPGKPIVRGVVLTEPEPEPAPKPKKPRKPRTKKVKETSSAIIEDTVAALVAVGHGEEESRVAIARVFGKDRGPFDSVSKLVDAIYADKV